MPTKITNHEDLALRELPQCFSAALKFRALVELGADSRQELEDLAYDLFAKRILSAAEGAQLDQYGDIVGMPRATMTDDEYRPVLSATFASLASHGTVDEILNIASLVVGTDVRYIWQGRANFALQWSLATSSADLILSYLNLLVGRAKKAGISYQAIEGETVAFQLDTAGAGLDEGQLCRRVDLLP